MRVDLQDVSHTRQDSAAINIFRGNCRRPTGAMLSVQHHTWLLHILFSLSSSGVHASALLPGVNGEVSYFVAELQMRAVQQTGQPPLSADWPAANQHCALLSGVWAHAPRVFHAMLACSRLSFLFLPFLVFAGRFTGFSFGLLDKMKEYYSHSY
jgi:hypothetical protein